MKSLRWCTIIVGYILLKALSTSAIEISPIIAAPILPFVPFFPVTATEFLPRDTPASYLREIRQTETDDTSDEITGRPCRPPVLVCVGDSLTHGSVSANWVSSLSRRLGDDDSYTVLNAGKNSETAAAVRVRLEEIVAVRPAAVAILIGTNDLIGSLDPTSAGAMYQRRLWWAQKTVPSVDGYARELEAIVHELDTRLKEFDTKIAVLSPPPLGEGGPTGPAWKQGERMATICSDICKKSSDRVTYIPLYDTVRDEMMNALVPPQLRPEGKQQQQSMKPRRREFSFQDAIPQTSFVVPWRILLRQPFDKIRAAAGYQYTIDSIHFGEEFADTVEEAVAAWVSSW